VHRHDRGRPAGRGRPVGLEHRRRRRSAGAHGGPLAQGLRDELGRGAVGPVLVGDPA
jgi:hypothetical protein